MIDTHAHLADSSFDSDLDEVIERARVSGVEAIVAVGESMADAVKNLEIESRYPGYILPAAGLFPTRLDLEEAARLVDWIRDHCDRLAAIGEVGLDYWKVQEEEKREIQRDILAGFVSLARELNLPLNVHSRSCGGQTIDFLLANGAERVQMHAFDGRAAKAMAGLDAGYLFSIPPSVVRSPQKQKLVKRLPLESLLVETDSPVLGPDAQMRNEPANAKIALKAIAEIKQLDLETVVAAVRENSLRLYGSRNRRSLPSGSIS